MMEWMVLLGVVSGMRTLTAVAVLCCAAWLHVLPLSGWAAWAGMGVSAAVFALMVLGEYVGDTLPRTPARITAFPLAARLVFGSFAGALAANAMQEPVAGGVLFGLLGAAIGSYGGYRLRTVCARRVGRDLPVALLESALALGLAVLAVHRLHVDLLTQRAGL